MASGKVLYAIRIPVDLKRLLDSAAKSGGVSTSQLVIDACWKYLDGGSSKRPAPEPSGRTAQKDGGYGAVDASAGRLATPTKSSVQPANMNPAMAAFMDQARVVIPIAELAQPIELCRHTEPCEDGETYRCRLAIGHKGKCMPGERVSA